MGIESLQQRQTFGIEEMGLLETEPLKTADLIVSLCADALQASLVALLVFDDRTETLFLRSAGGDTDAVRGTLDAPASESACALVRNEAAVLSITDLSLRSDTRHAAERESFGATGFLAAPVYGPAGDIVAVLAAMTPNETYWTRHQRKLISDYAYLASEHVLLRAALHTIKLMGAERDALGAFKFRH